MPNLRFSNVEDDENNKSAEENGELSMGEEAELNEFCETSSWETNSALDEEEFNVNTIGPSSGTFP